MKIIKTVSSDKFFEDTDGHYYKLKVENSNICLEFADGDPEDNALSRNFNDVYSILDLVKAAHIAGTLGETLEIETIEID